MRSVAAPITHYIVNWFLSLRNVSSEVRCTSTCWNHLTYSECFTGNQYLRTYALYGRSKRIGILILSTASVLSGISIVRGLPECIENFVDRLTRAVGRPRPEVGHRPYTRLS